MKLKIVNSGTADFPFYQLMDGKEEFCATNSIEKADMIQQALSDQPDQLDKPTEQWPPMASPVEIFKRLVELYPTIPVGVANFCDEVLDRSGALLGEVRNAVSVISNLPTPPQQKP